MFTGIVEAMGLVRKRGGSGLEIEIPKKWKRLVVGESLAVNGVCLTVASRRGGKVLFELLQETCKRTTLARSAPGDRVNLERPCKTGRRLGGHFVLGHVDGVGTVQKIVSHGRQKSFFVVYPKPFGPWLVEKGSVAVDGVSLTLGKISRQGFWVHCVPHTLRATSLGLLEKRSKVNLEADILLKMARQTLQRR